jgi:hypothetical protein
MTVLPILLADEETEAVFAAWRLANPGTREGIVIFGALGLVTLLSVLWAIFLRKPRQHRRSHHHSNPRSSKPAEKTPPLPPQRHHKRRRSRRRHRPRKPTLAETGGLPPLRPESPPGPPS